METMNFIRELLQRITPVTALFGVLTSLIISIIVFREQLVQLLSMLSPSFAQRLSKILKVDWSIRGHAFQIEFGQQVQKAKARAKGVEEAVVASRAMPAPDFSSDAGQQPGRDIVLVAWGALQQIVYDACTARKVPLTPATRVPEAVRRLGNANAINAEIAYLLNVLYDLGQKLANDPGLRPQEDDARGYTELADVVVDWMMLRILVPRNEEELKRPGTVVVAHFPQPRSGSPVALLVGVGGQVRGRRFSITKEHYRIGSNADNDLCITGDDYVAGYHASLRYEKGSLFLFDQGSRHGSFLNEKQVMETPVMVRQGDHIRLGASVFQVTEAPTEASRRPRRDRTRVE